MCSFLCSNPFLAIPKIIMNIMLFFNVLRLPKNNKIKGKKMYAILGGVGIVVRFCFLFSSLEKMKTDAKLCLAPRL